MNHESAERGHLAHNQRLNFLRFFFLSLTHTHIALHCFPTLRMAVAGGKQGGFNACTLTAFSLLFLMAMAPRAFALGNLKLEVIEAGHTLGAMCNDGSKYAYYVDRTSSDKWVFYLGGGGECWDDLSCGVRQKESPGEMTAATQSSVMGEGPLDPDPVTNPAFASFSKAYLPYCSSDLWSGTGGGGIWLFRGRTIVEQTLVDLSDKYELGQATDVLFTGGSAGGIGVLVNLNRVGDALGSARVQGLADAGWFLNMTTFNPLIPDPFAIAESGYDFWGASLDPDCMASASRLGVPPWACYSGVYVLPSLRRPTFFQQAMFDGGQLVRLGDGWPFTTSAAQQYALAFAADIRNTTSAIALPHALFSGSCASHAILEQTTNCRTFKIDGTSFYNAYADWFNANATIHLVDTCSSIVCNPTCPPPKT
eukprot:c11278_g1_i2.p1 GENE.c11278_g1_i2~~c11278_g1_i2.p1  ORF type:complete len:423 (+),score=48.02 c11278_g1_i2:79-1347(+)